MWYPVWGDRGRATETWLNLFWQLLLLAGHHRDQFWNSAGRSQMLWEGSQSAHLQVLWEKAVTWPSPVFYIGQAAFFSFLLCDCWLLEIEKVTLVVVVVELGFLTVVQRSGCLFFYHLSWVHLNKWNTLRQKILKYNSSEYLFRWNGTLFPYKTLHRRARGKHTCLISFENAFLRLPTWKTAERSRGNIDCYTGCDSWSVVFKGEESSSIALLHQCKLLQKAVYYMLSRINKLSYWWRIQVTTSTEGKTKGHSVLLKQNGFFFCEESVFCLRHRAHTDSALEIINLFLKVSAY